MEDSAVIAASLPIDGTNTTATTVPLSTDPVTFPTHSTLEIYSGNPGQMEGEVSSGERTIPLPELKAMLKQQLEYYFSRENLATDTYLRSQMDSDQYVPISTIARFNQIRRLTEDISLIVEVLRESIYVQVDEAGEKVRPNQQANVLILREIPESTPMKDLEELFNSENCPKFTRCEFAHNNTWYVLFDSDENTQRAYRYLREEARTFNGRPIFARLKNKSLTSAPFVNPYKNGVCNSAESDACSPQLPQQQQTALQYTYGNMPNENYNNQQICPPFYPPTMLQAWAPTTPTCVDLGTVFSMNGLSPQAAFRPLNNNTSRQNYTRERQVKAYNPPQNYNYTRSDQSSRYLGRNQSYLPRQQQQQQTQSSFPNLMNTNFDYLPYAAGSRRYHSFGMDVNFFTPNLSYLRNIQGHTSLYSAHTSQTRHNPTLLSRSQMGVSAINGQDQSYLSVGSSVLPFPKDCVLNVSSGMSKNSDSQGKDSWGPNQRQRSKRWWKENGANSSNKSLSDSPNGPFSKSSNDEKSESPKFDLETTAFPPLPGCLETDVLDVDVYESRLSDIVKGTVKPTTRDSKTQTAESALTVPPHTKDSATLTIEDTLPADGAFTPPMSPVTIKDNTSVSESPGINKNADEWGDEPLIEEKLSEMCINSNSINISSSLSMNATTFGPTISSTLNSSPVSSSGSSAAGSNASIVAESLDAASVPNDADKKHVSKAKSLDAVPKNKSVDLPSPKNKTPELPVKYNKADLVTKDKNLSMKQKTSAFTNNKPLESSLSKEKDFVVTRTGDTNTSKLSSDVNTAKDKQIQMQHSKSRSVDLTPKAKVSDSEPSSLLTINGHVDSESTISSEDEKPNRKLTYSEVAIRAKEKVEKIAQELKEKERQASVRHRQQEIVSQNRQAATRGPFRDFSRRYVEQRNGSRDWRDRKKPVRAVSLPSSGQ